MYKNSLVNPVNRLSSKFIPISVLGLHSVTTTFTLTTFEVKPFLFVVFCMIKVTNLNTLGFLT